MSTAAPARPHTDAVVAAIAAVGVLVDRGRKPDGAGWQGEPGASMFVPYAVLYPTPGLTDGDLADPHEYLDYTVQVTVVGAVQEQAEQAMDTVKTALIGVRLPVAGRSAYLVYPIVETPAQRDDQVSPPLHYAVLQVRFRTQPA